MERTHEKQYSDPYVSERCTGLIPSVNSALRQATSVCMSKPPHCIIFCGFSITQATSHRIKTQFSSPNLFLLINVVQWQWICAIAEIFILSSADLRKYCSVRNMLPDSEAFRAFPCRKAWSERKLRQRLCCPAIILQHNADFGISCRGVRKYKLLITPQNRIHSLL